MSAYQSLLSVAEPLGEAIAIQKDLTIAIQDPDKLSNRIEHVVRTASLGDERTKPFAQWLIRMLALEYGAIPASIHAHYMAHGQRSIRNDFTVPAMNLRALTFQAARAIFRSAKRIDAKAFIFEIARSEMGYTQQSPTEYTASILGAAIAECYRGPIFIQGDHFQVSASRYQKNAKAELDAIRALIVESMNAGFYNIDIDASTLVDLTKDSIPEQQKLNCDLSAELAAFVRSEEPDGVTVSLGGEIGEVGGHNSTEAELSAYIEGFNSRLQELMPGAIGLSKISIQTGTSHGGVVLPDGTVASVKVDFDCMRKLSDVAKRYGAGGAVQHGASTLPDEAFSKFPESDALEIHLATNFQNILFDHLPDALRKDIYGYLNDNFGADRKEGESEEQFLYKARKRAMGVFKEPFWNMDPDVIQRIENAWEAQFTKLFHSLNIKGTRQEIETTIHPKVIKPVLSSYVGTADRDEDVSDLAD
ncbi:MAG: class II fructose-bisphosphate aldolase [Anaerolineales bacterium]|nr:class II fructose-bisphosphate aldolase [Anaerolineales bacterium]